MFQNALQSWSSDRRELANRIERMRWFNPLFLSLLIIGVELLAVGGYSMHKLDQEFPMVIGNDPAMALTVVCFFVGMVMTIPLINYFITVSGAAASLSRTLKNSEVILRTISWTEGRRTVAKVYVLQSKYEKALLQHPEATLVMLSRYLVFSDEPLAKGTVVPTGNLSDAAELEKTPGITCVFARDMFAPFVSEGIRDFTFQRKNTEVVPAEKAGDYLAGKY
jgi:hypothetical protein